MQIDCGVETLRARLMEICFYRKIMDIVDKYTPTGRTV
jgi:hypothetical protein